MTIQSKSHMQNLSLFFFDRMSSNSSLLKGLSSLFCTIRYDPGVPPAFFSRYVSTEPPAPAYVPANARSSAMRLFFSAALRSVAVSILRGRVMQSYSVCFATDTENGELIVSWVSDRIALTTRISLSLVPVSLELELEAPDGLDAEPVAIRMAALMRNSLFWCRSQQRQLPKCSLRLETLADQSYRPMMHLLWWNRSFRPCFSSLQQC